MEKFLTEKKKDAIKLLFDAFKHLTTLSTGSIVLLAAFLKSLPVAVLTLIPKVLAEDGSRDQRVKNPFMHAAIASAAFFILGILALGDFHNIKSRKFLDAT